MTRIRAWTFRYGFTVVVLGHGIALGPCRDGAVQSWRPITVFRVPL